LALLSRKARSVPDMLLSIPSSGILLPRLQELARSSMIPTGPDGLLYRCRLTVLVPPLCCRLLWQATRQTTQCCTNRYPRGSNRLGLEEVTAATGAGCAIPDRRTQAACLQLRPPVSTSTLWIGNSLSGSHRENTIMERPFEFEAAVSGLVITSRM